MKLQSFFKIFVSVIFSIILFNSCSNLPDQAKLIPANAAFVGTIDVASIGQKGKFEKLKSLDMYKSALDVLENTDENTAALIESLVKDNSKSGIDIMSDLFIYSVFENEKGFLCVALKLDDKETFQGNLEEILSDNYDLKTDKDNPYTYYTNDSDSWIAFDDDVAVFITSLNSKPEDAPDFIESIFTQKKSETIIESEEFAEFYKNKKDISFWISTTQILSNLSVSFTEELKKSLEEFDGLSISDIENNYFNIFVNFDEDNISINFKLAANEAFKKYLDSKSFSKDNVNKDIFSYFPKKSYLFAAYAFDPKKLQEYVSNFNNYKAFETELADKGIQMKDVFATINGDFMVSLYDVSLDITKNNEETIIPKVSLILTMKDDVLFNNLMNNFVPVEMYKKVDNYYDFSEAFNYPLYVGFKNKMLLFSSDKDALVQLYKGPYSENFSNSEITSEIQGSAFYYVNLDYETYPILIKQQINKMGILQFIKPYTTTFKSITFSSEDDYSGTITITMKSDKENSLYQVIQLVDSNFKNQ